MANEPTKPKAERSVEGCNDSWLHEIAEVQKRAIQSYVRVDCWVQDFDLLHNASLYINFRFSFTNSCVYKLSLRRIEGYIYFTGKPLHESPTVASNEFKNVAINEVGWLTVRQKLTVEEAATVLYAAEMEFRFEQFHIELNAEPGGIESAPLHISSTVSNSQIFEQTPKLKMETLETRISGLFDRETHPGEDNPELGSVLNFRVRIQNPRPVPIEIKRFRLLVVTYPSQYIPAQEGQIGDITLLQFGEIKQTRNLLKNLNNCPIYLDPLSEPLEGWLQFIVRDVISLFWEVNTVTLIALDSRDEEHKHHFAPSDSLVQS